MATPRENIQKLDPYIPGEQLDTSVVTKLNTNENPHPPSPRVMEAVASLPAEKLRVYPPPLAQPFRQAAAQLHGLDASNIIATNGGDELLRLILTCYCEPGTEQGGIGVTDPTYSLYTVLAAIHDTPIVSVQRNDDFALAPDTVRQWNDAGCRVGMIVNPHAPTGRFESIDILRGLAESFNGLLLIDEAYIDFAPADAAQLVRDGVDNVILLRSLSKGYALAGLRFGYGIAHADIIAALDKARDSYNTDALSQAAAVAAIGDQTYAKQTWTSVVEQRGRLTAELRAREFNVLDSQSNFVLTIPPDKWPAAQLYIDLKAQNLLVRYFDAPRLDDKLRITVGTPEQIDKLLTVIDELT